ncbi:amidohydrolase family protein [Archangium lipolyticum]|uniref:amidohydrolase family protein n=1 Tax=Archangium lipolyticum TaxID=2970465 RepID=UPI00214A6965|nr:amidohydrolase [Archangium lipolyticum]
MATDRRLVVDLHCHALSLDVERLVADRPEKKAEPQLQLRAQGEASTVHNATVMLPKAMPKLTDIELRLRDMDAMGVDIQVVSPSPNQYYYWADEELAREVVRVQNEHIAALAGGHPRRVVHDPDVLRRLIEVVGASQVVIGTDYPFDMGAYDVQALVDAVPGLSDAERARILGLNAAELLGLNAVETQRT